MIQASKYTCEKCGKVSVLASVKPTLEKMKCECGVELVTFLKGVVNVSKPAPQNVVPATIATAPAKDSRPPAPVVFNPSNASQPAAQTIVTTQPSTPK